MRTEEARLLSVSPEATAFLAGRPAADLRRIAREVALFAIDAVKLDTIVDLEPAGEVPRSRARARLEQEVAQLDDEYFRLADAHAAGNATEREVLCSFARARALNSALFALSSEPFEAAAEAAYEAHAATDDLAGLLKVIGLTGAETRRVTS